MFRSTILPLAGIVAGLGITIIWVGFLGFMLFRALESLL
jgi:hypothetical protein